MSVADQSEPDIKRTDDQVLSNTEDLALLNRIGTGAVVSVEGNWGSAIMVMHLDELVGNSAAADCRRLAAEGLVVIPKDGPPYLTPRARGLLRAAQGQGNTSRS